VEPFQLSLFSTLGAVLVDGTQVEAIKQMSDSRLQIIRYHATDEAYARLVRIVIEVSGQTTWRITPSKASEEIRIDRYIKAGSMLRVALERGEEVNVDALPDLSSSDVLLEVLG